MMRITATVLMLALATCFARVSTWASRDDAHACCRGESPAPEKAPSLSECCATPALGGPLKVVRAELTAVFVESPASATTLVAQIFVVNALRPTPDPLRSTAAARAPPLA